MRFFESGSIETRMCKVEISHLPHILAQLRAFDLLSVLSPLSTVAFSTGPAEEIGATVLVIFIFTLFPKYPHI